MSCTSTSPSVFSMSTAVVSGTLISGGDRTTLDLPKDEETLLASLKATGKPLVVTLVNLGTVMAVLYFHQGPLVLLVAQGLVGVAGTLVMITLARCRRGSRRVGSTRG